MPRSFSGNSACMTCCPMHVYSKTSFFSLAIRTWYLCHFSKRMEIFEASPKSQQNTNDLEIRKNKETKGRFRNTPHLWRQQLRPKRPEPRFAREMAEFSRRYLRCHDYVSSDPDIFKHLLDHNSTSRRTGFVLLFL